MKRLREKDGLSYGAGSNLQAGTIDAVGVLICYAILAPQNAAKGLTAMIEEVDRLAGSGITAEELAIAKTGYVKDFERSLSSDHFVVAQLVEALYLNRTLDFFAQINAKVGAITLDQVNAVARKYVKAAAFIKVTGADKKKAAGAPAPAAPATPTK